MITVTVKYMVNLIDKTGRRRDDVDLPEGSRLSDLAAWLSENRDLDLPDPKIMATLNGRGWSQYGEGMETPLSNGDTVLLFPPISGG